MTTKDIDLQRKVSFVEALAVLEPYNVIWLQHRQSYLEWGDRRWVAFGLTVRSPN